MREKLRRAETLPASWYCDPTRYQRERERIFAREWLWFGHESQLRRPGDALAETIAGWPLFVVRDPEGRLRGFHNVCRHRAGPIFWDGAHQCRELRCRYHGWLYGFDGRLRRAPDFGDAEGFDASALSLAPIQVASWRGFVFVNLDPEAPALAEWITAFADAAAGVPLEALALHAGERVDIACNWKVYAENYLEGYHIPSLHPALNREVALKDYVVEVGENFAVHRAPPRPRLKEPVYEGFWAWLAPNVAFNVYAHGMSVERMSPLGPESMRLDYLFLFREGSDARAPECEAALAMSRQVTQEDRAICEAVQRNLVAGVYRQGRLSPRHEAGVFAFQSRVRAWLA